MLYLEIASDAPIRIDEEGDFLFRFDLVEVGFEDEPVEVHLHVSGEHPYVHDELPLDRRMERVYRLHRPKRAGVLRGPDLLLASVPFGESLVAAEVVVDDVRSLRYVLGIHLQASRSPRMPLSRDLGEPVARRVDPGAYRHLVPRYPPEPPAVAQDQLGGVDGDEGLVEPDLPRKHSLRGDETRGHVVDFQPPDVHGPAGKADDVAYLLLEAVLEGHGQKQAYLLVGKLARGEARPGPVVEIRIRAVRVPAFPFLRPVLGDPIASASRASAWRLLVLEHEKTPLGRGSGGSRPKESPDNRFTDCRAKPGSSGLDIIKRHPIWVECSHQSLCKYFFFKIKKFSLDSNTGFCSLFAYASKIRGIPVPKFSM